MHEKYKRAIEAERAVNVLSRRMTMRFSPDHPVAKTYATVSHTLDGQERHLRGIVDRVVDHDPQTGDVVVLTEAEDEVDTAHGAAAATGFQAFAEAARAEVGATGRGT
jgi:hypothetical protein